MSTYLNGSSKIKVNSISFANIFVSFIYGAKVTLMTRKQNKNFPKKALLVNTQTEPAQPSTKKRRSYSVTIVMQATFQGMETIINQMCQCICKPIDIYYLLSTILTSVPNLIKEIELFLTNSYINSEIKLICRDNKEDIEHYVRTQIKNLSFLETYFNILFLKITELKFNEIVNIVLMNRGL